MSPVSAGPLRVPSTRVRMSTGALRVSATLENVSIVALNVSAAVLNLLAAQRSDSVGWRMVRMYRPPTGSRGGREERQHEGEER